MNILSKLKPQNKNEDYLSLDFQISEKIRHVKEKRIEIKEKTCTFTQVWIGI